MSLQQEVAWISLLNSHLGVRQIYYPTTHVSIQFSNGPGGPNSIVDRVPLGEFRLPSFRIRSDNRWGWNIAIVLWATDVVTHRTDSKRFFMFWRPDSRTTDLKDPRADILRFSGRMPERIKVIIPVLPSPKDEPLKFPGSTPPALKVPLSDPKKVIQSIVQQHLADSTPMGLKLKKPHNDSVLGSPGKHHRVSPEVVTEDGIAATFFNGTLQSSSPQSWETYRRQWTSVNTPGFRSLSRKGQLPMNPYSLSITKTRPGPVRITTTNSSGTLSQYFPVAVGSYLVPPDEQQPNIAARNRTIAKLQSRADAGLTANIAQTLVQWRQLNHLVGNVASKIASSIYYTRHKQFKNAAKVLVGSEAQVAEVKRRWGKPPKDIGEVSVSKSLAENILALQFGWKPLLQDLHGALQLLAQESTRVKRVKVTATSYAGPTESSRSTPSTVLGSSGVKATIPWQYRESEIVKGVLYYSLDDRLVSYLNQTGFTMPVSLAWEVLPWSFLYDYVINIGPLLETLEGWQGLNFVGGTISSLRNQEVSVSFEDNRLDSFGTFRTTAIVYGRTKTIFVREKLLSFPRAELRLKNPVSFQHSLNALALLERVANPGKGPFAFR